MAKIKGLQKVMNNLNREIGKIKEGTMKGLIESAAFIRVDMDKTPPKIPIDTSNLRSSWFTTPNPTPKGPSLILGFGAAYAVFVHENLEARNWNRPGSGAKFFEAALKRNTKEILRIIGNNAKI